MVKHIQTIRWQFADELFECVWPFCGISTQRVKHFFMRILLGQKHLSLRSPGIVITISPCKYVKQWTSIIASVRMGHQNCNSTAGQQLIDSGESFCKNLAECVVKVISMLDEIIFLTKTDKKLRSYIHIASKQGWKWKVFKKPKVWRNVAKTHF